MIITPERWHRYLEEHPALDHQLETAAANPWSIALIVDVLRQVRMAVMEIRRQDNGN